MVVMMMTRPVIAYIPAMAITPKTQTKCSSSQIGMITRNDQDNGADANTSSGCTRRDILRSTFLATTAGIVFGSATLSPQVAWAAVRPPLDECLYRILRVREATQQETRLIKTGKFKDVQRANVKLAVRFIVENYKLNDSFVAASAYLDGNQKRVEAGQVGQIAVQNLYTILEYFDAADVQNIKVSSGLSGRLSPLGYFLPFY